MRRAGAPPAATGDAAILPPGRHPALLAGDGPRRLSNKNCTGDGKLDRGGLSGTSQGWLTNQMTGTYVGDDGQTHHRAYFVKIVYVGPARDGRTIVLFGRRLAATGWRAGYLGRPADALLEKVRPPRARGPVSP